MILQANDVTKSDPFTECFVYSPDTVDSFLPVFTSGSKIIIMSSFSIFYWTNSKNQYLSYFILQGYKVSNRKKWTISRFGHECHPKMCDAILGFHTFTGCDQVWRFNGKSKSTCWSSFITSSEVIHFPSLDHMKNLPDLETVEALERYIINVYRPKQTDSLKSLSQLRWYFFSKYRYEGEKLPPTFSALKYKMFRAHYVTMVLRRSHFYLILTI